MPWAECDQMTERMEFVVRRSRGERMSDLCREYGISRKTGYKIWSRFKAEGVSGLNDRTRAPARKMHKLPEAVAEAILALKAQYPTWGAKKLRAILPERYPGIRVPAQSTIHEVLSRNDLVKRRKPRRKRAEGTGNLRTPKAANELWCADFKGQFRLGDRSYCYPLTVTDGFSRFVLGCEALDGTSVKPAMVVFEELFAEYGLPSAIRTDNGVPFATKGLMGWSKLSAWWARLGIELQRIEPGHPEQNGQHERFHLTLKRETTRPAAENALRQQDRFDRFCRVFNEERPHEGLAMRRPAELYHRSLRVLPESLPELVYPLHDRVVRVYKHGHVSLGGRGRAFYLSSVLSGELVGLRELERKRWLVTYAATDVGIYDERDGVFTAAG